MPLSCAAYNCSNRSGTRSDFSGHFHSFPKDDPLRAKWLVAVRREKFKPSSVAKLCSDHFLPSDYHPYSRELRKGVVPSVFSFPIGNHFENESEPELFQTRYDYLCIKFKSKAGENICCGAYRIYNGRKHCLAPPPPIWELTMAGLL